MEHGNQWPNWNYSIPASDIQDKLGILEIPVTRMIPSFRYWTPFTMTPSTPLLKAITIQSLLRSRWENPFVVAPIFHSYGDKAVRLGRKTFDRFLEQLDRMITYLLKKHFVLARLNEVYFLICETIQPLSSIRED